MIYQANSRTNSVSEIPHLYVKQMLDALYNRQPGGPPSADPAAEANWKNNPNLVVGGDFQSGGKRRAQGLGACGRAKPRAAGQSGAMGGRGRQSRQQDYPLHFRRRPWAITKA